jgi:hypothetical protein
MLRTCIRLRTPPVTARFTTPFIWSRYYSSKPTMSHFETSHPESTQGENEWKARPPYRVHEPNEEFHALYEASCHCGQVEYQLSREKPLDSKLCHCTTCQTQHGKFAAPYYQLSLFNFRSCTLPMGGHLPKRRHQLQQGPPLPGMVRSLRKDNRTQTTV